MSLFKSLPPGYSGPSAALINKTNAEGRELVKTIFLILAIFSPGCARVRRLLSLLLRLKPVCLKTRRDQLAGSSAACISAGGVEVRVFISPRCTGSLFETRVLDWDCGRCNLGIVDFALLGGLLAADRWIVVPAG